MTVSSVALVSSVAVRGAIALVVAAAKGEPN